VFLFADGEARLVRDDVVEATLPLPAGAPQPQEPLLWVLSLPYSPSVTP
jgi:hypothetical protein